MGYKRDGDPKWNPKTRRWTLYAPKATSSTYLGGLTAPSITGRPHMGPFNRVMDYKIDDADEVYRQHDIGYGKLAAKGKNPYFRWNKYDQDLMDAPSTGWADYVAKGVFGAKRFITYGMPYTKNTQLKDTYGTYTNYKPKQRTWEPTSYEDFIMNEQTAPVIYEGGGTDPDVLALNEMIAAQKWSQHGEWARDSVQENARQNDSGGQGTGKSKLQIKSYIQYN